MAVADLLASSGYGIKMAIGAELVFQLVGSNMSSPQTGELDAPARAPTIKKWINLTVVESVAWIALLTVVDRSSAWAVGGGLALVSMHLKYNHAIAAGLANGGRQVERPGRSY